MIVKSLSTSSNVTRFLLTCTLCASHSCMGLCIERLLANVLCAHCSDVVNDILQSVHILSIERGSSLL